MKAAVIAGALATLVGMGVTGAQAQQAQVGVLECNVSGGVGFIFGSTRSLGCTFNRADGRPEYYTGSINRFGLDIGITGSAVIIWNVFATNNRVGPGALAGTYGGVGADASFGVGLGANALIGGSNRTIALQPIQVEAKTGINVAAGIAEIELQPAAR